MSTEKRPNDVSFLLATLWNEERNVQQAEAAVRDAEEAWATHKQTVEALRQAVQILAIQEEDGGAD